MKYQIVISFETAYTLTPTEAKFLTEKLRIELDKNPVTITELILQKLPLYDLALFDKLTSS